MEDATGQDDPDEYLKVLGNAAAQGDEESKRELLGLLKQAGPMPKADFDELSNAYGLDDNQKMAFIKLFKVKSDVAADAAGAMKIGASNTIADIDLMKLKPNNFADQFRNFAETVDNNDGIEVLKSFLKTKGYDENAVNAIVKKLVGEKAGQVDSFSDWFDARNSHSDQWLDWMSRRVKNSGILSGAASKSTSNAADVASQAVTRTATGAAQSLKELGKLALGGDAKAADAYMQKFLVSGKAGETQYRILKTAFDAKIIDKEKFFSGVGTQTLNLSAQLRGNVPVSINGVSVIDYLTPTEASNAYTAMSVAKSMGNVVDEDALAKLAAKAGKAVTNAVNMSPEDDLRLEGNQVTNVVDTASKAVKESLYKTLIKKLYI